MVGVWWDCPKVNSRGSMRFYLSSMVTVVVRGLPQTAVTRQPPNHHVPHIRTMKRWLSLAMSLSMRVVTSYVKSPSIRRSSFHYNHHRCVSKYPSTPAKTSFLSQTMNHNNNNDHHPYSTDADPTLSGYQRPKVNWYPGHIAKAERQLSETLKSVDVVIEVRDARAPKATSHPKVGEWSAGRPRVVVLTRVDAVTTRSRESWVEAYRAMGADRTNPNEENGKHMGVVKNRNEQFQRERRKYDTNVSEDKDENGSSYGRSVEEVLFVDAKRGQGTHAISRAVYKAGRHVNERRKRRGLNDRPLRVGIIGFPNVGKVSPLVTQVEPSFHDHLSFVSSCQVVCLDQSTVRS